MHNTKHGVLVYVVSLPDAPPAQPAITPAPVATYGLVAYHADNTLLTTRSGPLRICAGPSPTSLIGISALRTALEIAVAEQWQHLLLLTPNQHAAQYIDGRRRATTDAVLADLAAIHAHLRACQARVQWVPPASSPRCDLARLLALCAQEAWSRPPHHEAIAHVQGGRYG